MTVGGEYFRLGLSMTEGERANGVLVWTRDGREYSASADGTTVMGVLKGLERHPDVPPGVARWLTNGAPADGGEADVMYLKEVNDSLRGAVDAARGEAALWRRMVDILLDRLEGRHR